MIDFRQNFLAESINNLTILQKELTEEFTVNLRRAAFRTIHTIKGGAQTLGMKSAAELAHELENVLSGNNNFQDKTMLLDGIDFLINSLRQSEPDQYADFIEKLQAKHKPDVKSDVILTKIPPQAYKKFSAQERRATIAALRERQNIYCVEVGFEIAKFADEYRNLRNILSEKGEILASLPSEKYKSEGVIGFQIFLASFENIEALRQEVKDFDIEISSHACPEKSSNELLKMLSQVAAHVEDLAEKSGKDISVTILAHDINLSDVRTKFFFDILLHLVRNAVDHAIEQKGAIEIRVFEEFESLRLSVADDGKGIDLPKIRAVAAAKNLISIDTLLDERETLELIFTHGFSTAETITEVSGRGVGLDSVKDLVEKMNGKITVRNRKTNGAIFEITVPRD